MVEVELDGETVEKPDNPYEPRLGKCKRKENK